MCVGCMCYWACVYFVYLSIESCLDSRATETAGHSDAPSANSYVCSSLFKLLLQRLSALDYTSFAWISHLGWRIVWPFQVIIDLFRKTVTSQLLNRNSKAKLPKLKYPSEILYFGCTKLALLRSLTPLSESMLTLVSEVSRANLHVLRYMCWSMWAANCDCEVLAESRNPAKSATLSVET